ADPCDPAMPPKVAAQFLAHGVRGDCLKAAARPQRPDRVTPVSRHDPSGTCVLAREGVHSLIVAGGRPERRRACHRRSLDQATSSVAKEPVGGNTRSPRRAKGAAPLSGWQRTPRRAVPRSSPATSRFSGAFVAG